MPVPLIIPGRQAAGQRVSSARPEAFPAGIEVTIVFMQRTGEPESDRALDGVLAHDVDITFAIARHPLPPLRRLVSPLVNARGEPAFDIAKWIGHCFQIKLSSFFLGQRQKVAGLLCPGHVEVVKDITKASGNHARAPLFERWAGILRRDG